MATIVPGRPTPTPTPIPTPRSIFSDLVNPSGSEVIVGVCVVVVAPAVFDTEVCVVKVGLPVDAAALGTPHCVGTYFGFVVVGAVAGRSDLEASFVGSTIQNVDESVTVASEMLQPIGCVRSV